MHHLQYLKDQYESYLAEKESTLESLTKLKNHIDYNLNYIANIDVMLETLKQRIEVEENEKD